MNGPLTSDLADRLDQLLREHLVVVWYDPEEAFTGFFGKLGFDATRKLRFDGSYLQLRRHAEEVTGHLPDRGNQHDQLLVYVPADPLPPTDDLLAPLEEIGERFDDSLQQVARSALEGTDVASQVSEWTSRPGMTIERLEELAQDEAKTGALATVFHNLGPRELLFRFLRDEAYARDIDEHHLLQDLLEHIRRVLGLELQGTIDDAHQARTKLAHALLLTEFVDDLDAPSDLTERHALPSEDAAVRACRDLTRRLRDDRTTSEQYRTWAEESEERYGLAEMDLPPDKLGGQDTFPFEDDRVFEHTVELALEDRWEEARDRAARRRDGFWARERRSQRWRAVHQATELKREVDRERERTPTTDDPTGWIAWYTADEGGWRIDQMRRRLDALMVDLAEGGAVEEMVAQVQRHAAQLEADAAQAFVKAVAIQPDALGGVPAQLDVVRQEVHPLLESAGEGPVVLVLADALRYEMGRELTESLREFGEAELGYALASLPTLTRIGMAALVPGAENGMELTAEAGKVVPRVEGEEIDGVSDRVARFRASYGSRVLDLPIEQCRELDRRVLQQKIEGADLVLLRSQEIDLLGETDSLFHIRTMVQHLVPGLKSAIRRLATAGAEHFVVVADHGYLVRDDVSEGHKLEVPSGEVIEKHRRSVVGRELGRGEGYEVLDAGDLGLGGDLDLAFPKGANVFKASGGNMAYFHGGLSLQEVVVPVLRHRTSTPETERKRPEVKLALDKMKITNRIFGGTLSYQAGDLFDQDVQRSLRVDLFEDEDPAGGLIDSRGTFDEESGELLVSNGDEFSVTLQLSEHLEDSGTLELRVTDVESGEVVERKEVEYELAF